MNKACSEERGAWKRVMQVMQVIKLFSRLVVKSLSGLVDSWNLNAYTPQYLNALRITRHPSRLTSYDSRLTSHPSPITHHPSLFKT